ncbi:MAG: hypothetical protein JSV84_06275 [Gemmatimonadota bacterium]|nr:MAG: hypothetical protein JSV84_06275 [Gemmatimonadota bacterium]
MPRHRFAYVIALISLLPLAPLQTQEHTGLSLHHKETVLQGDGTRGPYPLPDYFVLAQSEKVELEGQFLKRDLDYVIDVDKGEITFAQSVPVGTSIRITYRRLPIGLKRTYLHRHLVRSEGPVQRPLTIAKKLPQRRLDLPDMSSLRVGGSKSLGISLGSDRDLSLEQSLRVNITGQIARNVEVIALLSDQSSPLQPEGTTQTLEELDKVSIELRGKHARAAFGDYTLSYQKTEFGRFERKLQGALGELTRPSGQLAVSGASSKGHFTTNRFTGIEGNQGPYQLRADDGSTDIIVLAGTERVWIDGEHMTRGENNDYIIEYANGQITFTRHRLITVESRIVIDFEHVDEKYRRSLYTARGFYAPATEKLRLGAAFFHEADDKNDPLGITLSDIDRDALSAAGDDPEAAFSYADDGSTKVYLPLPHSHSLADFDLTYSSGGLALGGELGISRLDNNVLSEMDDSDNVGQAFKITGALTSPRLTWGNHTVGNIELTGFYRSFGERFQPVGRIRIAEYDRRWNLPSDLSPGTENVGELNAVYRPNNRSAFGFGLGRIERGTAFQGSRDEIRTDLAIRGLPHINYLLESIHSRDSSQPDSAGLLESDWTRHNLRSAYTLWKLKPNISFEGERKEDTRFGRIEDGFKFYEIEGMLSTFDVRTIGVYTGFTLRKDWTYEERWLEASESKTIRQGFALKEWRSLSVSAEYTRRMKHFLETGGSDRTTDLADLKIDYTPLDRALSSHLRYQISSLQAAQRERQFIDVGEWRGNYRFELFQDESGDSTGEYVYDPGKQESRYILRTKTVGEFEPVLELKASLNLKLSPHKYYSEKKGDITGFAQWLSMIETETLIKIEEKSKEKDKWAIYLFDLSAFQQDSTTVDGRITLRQDCFLFPRRQKFNVRLRYEHSRDEKNQLLEQGSSRIFGEEHLRRDASVRVRSKIAAQFDLQTEFKSGRNMRQIQDQITYDIRSSSVSADLGFRPQSRLELSLKTNYDRDIDRESEQRSRAVTLVPGISYSILRKGRVRADVSWTRVSVERENLALYYTMAGGKKLGNNIDWSLNLDYRVHRYVTAFISYTGRSEPDRRVIHSGRAEMRAFF